MTTEQFRKHIENLGFKYSNNTEPISPESLDIKAELITRYSKLLTKSQPQDHAKMLFLMVGETSLVVGFDTPKVGQCYFEHIVGDEQTLLNGSHFCKTSDVAKNCKTVLGY